MSDLTAAQIVKELEQDYQFEAARFVEQQEQQIAELNELLASGQRAFARATEMEEAAEAKIAQAPHDRTCGGHPMNGVSDHGCTCWKPKALVYHAR